jgi:adenylate cyclase
MAPHGKEDSGSTPSLTFWQRRSLKRVVKEARKNPNEALSPEDWEAYFRFSAQPSTRFGKRIMRSIPSTPRCGYCGAPFAGIGARIVGPLGYRPSRKNPNICSTCVELAPPGGTTLEVGVLFADLRGFTSDSELRTPVETSAALRRFYAHAEKVLFPEALIDKLIGDEIMALYVPSLVCGVMGGDLDDGQRQHVAHVMLGHARELLQRVGYGSREAPEFAVGIGLDFGEAFVGNIGDRAVHDFTAVGDVVNTASRLQGHAVAGEVIISQRLARWLPEPVGSEERIELRGKQDLVDVRRISWFTDQS